jgi:hypothetical protein
LTGEESKVLHIILFGAAECAHALGDLAKAKEYAGKITPEEVEKLTPDMGKRVGEMLGKE